MTWIFVLFALASGAANPFQAGTNAELNKQLGAPLVAGLWVYLSGLLVLCGAAGLVALFRPVGFAHLAGALNRVSWWAWLGGAISIASTLTGLLLAHKLGSVVFTGLTITASVVTSVLLDHFGLVGFTRHSASPGRLLGCALLIAGAWMVARF